MKASTEHERRRKDDLRLHQEQLEIASSAAKASKDRENILMNRLTILQDEFERRKVKLGELEERYNNKKLTWGSRLKEVRAKYSESQLEVQRYQQEKMDLMEQLLEERLKHAASLKDQSDHHEAFIRERRASFDKERKFLQIQLETLTKLKEEPEKAVNGIKIEEDVLNAGNSIKDMPLEDVNGDSDVLSITMESAAEDLTTVVDGIPR